MKSITELFFEYTELRTAGHEIEKANQLLRDDVRHYLDQRQRDKLQKRCMLWERERTQLNLTPEQQEAIKRAALTNITVQITFCPNCDAPNSGGFTKCQVCNESLVVAQEVSHGTNEIHHEGQGSLYQRESELILEMLTTSHRLRLQPQMSPNGLKLGRKTEASFPDVNLDTIGAVDYGVSRIHATLRYDSKEKRLLIIDNDSTNGTFVNNFRLPPNMESTISDGDVLQFGKMAFKVYIK